jgi:hypothetical protein
MMNGINIAQFLLRKNTDHSVWFGYTLVVFTLNKSINLQNSGIILHYMHT